MKQLTYDFPNIYGIKSLHQTDLTKYGLKPTSEVYYKIVIPIRSEGMLKHIEEIEDALHKKGTHFNLGVSLDEEGNIKTKHWFLDSSLRGKMTTEKIMYILRGNQVQFDTIILPRL